MVTLGFKNTSPANHKARIISVMKKTREELSIISVQGVYIKPVIEANGEWKHAIAPSNRSTKDSHSESACWTDSERSLTGRILSFFVSGSRSFRRVLRDLLAVNEGRPPRALVKTLERRNIVEKLMVNKVFMKQQNSRQQLSRYGGEASSQRKPVESVRYQKPQA